MQIVWRLKKAFIREIMEELDEPKPHYNTVATIVKILEKKGILQSFIIKEPLEIDYENDSVDDIVTQIEYAIEQHPSFLKVLTPEQIKDEQEYREQRRFWGPDSKREEEE